MNEADGNAAYGFYVLGTANIIGIRASGNGADSNGIYGFYDGTSGTGTSGTANTYTQNHCGGNGLAGSSPPGLCFRHTSMHVGCSPTTSGTPTTCAAYVTDDELVGTPVTPTGKVKFSSSLAGTFSSNKCTLSGSGLTASCSVTFTPTSTGVYKISGKYSGDSLHLGSKDKSMFIVS